MGLNVIASSRFNRNLKRIYKDFKENLIANLRFNRNLKRI